MKKHEGYMNIDFNEYYDQDGDVYYVSFKTGEPSYVVEVDDILLLEVGLYTSLPTGFRILNYKKHNVVSVKLPKVKINEISTIIRNIMKDRPLLIKPRVDKMKAALEKVLA